MVLVRYQSTGHFGERLRRQHGLGPFSGITAPYAAYIEGRPAGIAFQRTVSFFTEDIIHIDRLVIFLLRERDLRNHLSLLFRDRQHIVVETRYRDASVLIHHLRDHLAKRIHGVLHRPTEMTGVQVAIRSVHFDLPVRQTTQTGGDGGCVFTDHRRVGNQDNIGLQHLFMIL